MDDLDDIPGLMEPVTPPSGAGTPRKCRHPKHRRLYEMYGGWTCLPCGHVAPAERVAAGRRANRRGRRIQKAAMEAAGMDNLPGNLPGLDGSRGLFRGESKSGSRFPETLWRWLKAIPAAPGQIPVLVISDAPGQGRKRRQLVVLELTDWKGLHGEDAA